MHFKLQSDRNDVRTPCG